VVGAPRSGTSMLYKALCLHPEAAWMSQWMRRFPTAPWLAGLNRLVHRSDTARQRAWFSSGNAYVYGRRRGPAERLFPHPVEGETVFNSWGLPERLIEQPLAGGTQDALRMLFASIARWSGGSVVVNKRIANNLRISTLAAAFPSAVFIDIVRDGRAVAASLAEVDWWEDSKLWWCDGVTPAEWAAAGKDPWEACAREWVEEVRLLKNSLGRLTAGRVLHLRYEDVVADPIPMLTKVASFAGLPDSEVWSTRIEEMGFPPPETDKWRRNLPPDVIRRITRIEAVELRAEGYPVSPDDADPEAR